MEWLFDDREILDHKVFLVFGLIKTKNFVSKSNSLESRTKPPKSDSYRFLEQIFTANLRQIPLMGHSQTLKNDKFE